jgi:hypothetical protein
MTAHGRHLLYTMTGVEVPVSASKQLFTMRDFQRNEGPEADSAVSDFIE